MSDAKLVSLALERVLNCESVDPVQLREACHAADRLCAATEDKSVTRFVALVDRLRERGAVYVRCGDMSAEFKATALEMRPTMVLQRDEPVQQRTPEEIADADDQLYIP